MMWKIPAKNCEYRDRTKLNCLEASRAKCLNCQNFIISDTISKKSVLYFRTEQNRPNMSVYPSLEDMKVDHMMQVQSLNLEKVKKSEISATMPSLLIWYDCKPLNFPLWYNF